MDSKDIKLRIDYLLKPEFEKIIEKLLLYEVEYFILHMAEANIKALKEFELQNK